MSLRTVPGPATPAGRRPTRARPLGGCELAALFVQHVLRMLPLSVGIVQKPGTDAGLCRWCAPLRGPPPAGHAVRCPLSARLRSSAPHRPTRCPHCAAVSTRTGVRCPLGQVSGACCWPSMSGCLPPVRWPAVRAAHRRPGRWSAARWRRRWQEGGSSGAGSGPAAAGGVAHNAAGLRQVRGVLPAAPTCRSRDRRLPARLAGQVRSKTPRGSRGPRPWPTWPCRREVRRPARVRVIDPVRR